LGALAGLRQKKKKARKKKSKCDAPGKRIAARFKRMRSAQLTRAEGGEGNSGGSNGEKGP